MPALDKTLESALNHHVTEELAASHIYLASSSALRESGLSGMAAWMAAQSDEERMHATKFLDHIHARHGHIRLEAIPAPPAATGKAMEAFQDALALEESTTRRIHDLHALAAKVGDVATRVFMEWFVQEQVQEEDQLRHILDRFRLARDDPAAILLLDQELGNRAQGAGKGKPA